MTIAQRQAREAYERQNPWRHISTFTPDMWGMIVGTDGTTASPINRRRTTSEDRGLSYLTIRTGTGLLDTTSAAWLPSRMRFTPRLP